MIKTYSGLKGLTVILLLLTGVVLVASFFFWGITKASEFLLPSLSVVSYALIVLFLLCVWPLSFMKKLRPDLSRYSSLMSKVLGVTTWMMAFLFVVTHWGFWGVFFTFLFQFLAPIALIAAMYKGAWDTVGNLFLLLSFTYVMRYFSQWLSVSKGNTRNRDSRVIDVEIEP